MKNESTHLHKFLARGLSLFLTVACVVATMALPTYAYSEQLDQSSPPPVSSPAPSTGTGVVETKPAAGTHHHFYRNQLETEAEKQFYDLIEQDLLKSGANTSSLPLSTTSMVFSPPIDLPAQYTIKSNDLEVQKYCAMMFQRTLDAFRFDHPEFYWTTGNSIAQDFVVRVYGDGSLSLHSVKAFFEGGSAVTGDAQAINSIVNTIVAEAKKQPSDYQKLKTVHDMLSKHLTYGINNSSPYRAFQITGGLVDQKGVCEAYSKAFKLISDKLGFQTILAVGTGQGSNGAEPHMWNYVKVGGSWYAVDVTWDDQVIIVTDFFLVGRNTAAPNFGDSTFGQLHKEEYRFSEVNYKNFQYPALSNTAYSK